MKKKICIALIGALTAAAFAGCSGGGSSQSGETTAETAGSQEAGTETPEGGSAQKADSGEITVYTALEDEQVSDYLAKFNETYPDITVNVVRESTGIITAKLIAEKKFMCLTAPSVHLLFQSPLQRLLLMNMTRT